MATGYTYQVVDGKITELKDFIKICSGAYYSSEFLRTNREDYELYTEQIDELIAEKLEFEQKYNTKEKQIAYGKHSIDHETISIQEQIENRKIVVQNLEAMQKKVMNWKVSENLRPLKDFMLGQLEDTIKFDGNLDYISLPKLNISEDHQDRQPFLDKLEFLENTMEYYVCLVKENLEEKQKYELWKKELEQSLGE